jgi:hypothetical protein
MNTEKKIMNTLVGSNQDESSVKVEGYCGKNYGSSSETVTCGGNYSSSSSSTSSASDGLDILI